MRKARYLKKAVFFNAGGGQTRQAVNIGGDIAIRVVFSLPRSTRYPVLGVIARRSETGEAVFGSNSRVCGQPVLNAPAFEATIDLFMSHLYLVPGVYLMDVWLGCDNDDIECVEGVLELEIIDNDPHGTGKPPFTNFGACFVQMVFKAY